MGRLPRVVRWSSEQEWEEVHALLMSSELASLKEGLVRVAGWRARGSLPLAVETTYAVVHAVCQDAGKALDPLSLRQLYAMVVIRFVNGFCDAEQKGKNARSVQTIATELEIPIFIVDLRHDATHTALPSLASLRVAIPVILGWLKEHYWERQEEHLTDARESVAAQIKAYALKVAADAKHAKTDAILKQVVQSISPNTLHTTLLPALLEDGLLVPAVTATAARHTTLITTQVQKQQFKLWSRALRKFASTWPHFVPLLLSNVLHKMAQVAAEEAEDCGGGGNDNDNDDDDDGTEDTEGGRVGGNGAGNGNGNGISNGGDDDGDDDDDAAGAEQPPKKRRRRGSSTGSISSGNGVGGVGGVGGGSGGGAAAYAVRMGDTARQDTLTWLGHWARWLLKAFALDAATKRSLLRECTAIPCKAAADTMTALRTSLQDPSASAALGKLAKLAAACPAILGTPTRGRGRAAGAGAGAGAGRTANADDDEDEDEDKDEDEDEADAGNGNGKRKTSEAAAFQLQVQGVLFAEGAASRSDPAGSALHTPWGLGSEWQWSGVPIGVLPGRGGGGGGGGGGAGSGGGGGGAGSGAGSVGDGSRSGGGATAASTDDLTFVERGSAGRNGGGRKRSSAAAAASAATNASVGAGDNVADDDADADADADANEDGEDEDADEDVSNNGVSSAGGKQMIVAGASTGWEASVPDIKSKVMLL